MEVMAMVYWLSPSIIFIVCVWKWTKIRYQSKHLPPGKMGLPFIGETRDFLKHGPEFMKKQRSRYGSIFKTHVLGSPMVISMDAELNRYILMNESKGLIPGYNQSMLDILGTRNIAAVFGSTHRYIRNNLLSLIGASMVKERIFPRLDMYTRLFISNLDEYDMTIDIQEKSMEMAFLMALTHLAEPEWSSINKTLKSQFDMMHSGTLSLPIYFPGTKYYQGLKGRRNAIKIITQLMKKRRASSNINYDDMLDQLLKVDAKYKLNDEEIIDQIITILNSGYETVSRTMMMAVKYLHDHSQALQELRDEHFAIRKGKRQEEQLIWDDFKYMRFTRAVILETIRLAVIINGLLRKTTKDVDLNGFIIPKGWRIYVYTREINLDPILFPEPLEFNPWRWMLDEKLETHNYFLLFGGGSRLCPGKELGIVKVATFLHYFVTTYRWEEIGGEKILQFPRVEVPNGGYHIKIMKMEFEN